MHRLTVRVLHGHLFLPYDPPPKAKESPHQKTAGDPLDPRRCSPLAQGCQGGLRVRARELMRSFARYKVPLPVTNRAARRYGARGASYGGAPKHERRKSAGCYGYQPAGRRDSGTAQKRKMRGRPDKGAMGCRR